MQEYHDLVRKILNEGVIKEDRTGVGTMSIFGHQMRFDSTHGFPLVTTKKTNFHAVAVELLWFLKGDTNIKFLYDHGVHIWDEWADEKGNLGPVYGSQWRSWWINPDSYDQGYSFDQIANVIDSIKTDPYSRRHIVTAWNPSDIQEMALPPCHTMFQFNVRPGPDGEPYWLDCHLYQRSGDVFLGVPFNIASYALLTEMVAQVTGLVAGDFVHTLGDAHLYSNHIDLCDELLSREILFHPILTLNPDIKNINDFTIEDIKIEQYKHHPFIKADVAV